MSLESGNFIIDLVTTNPEGTDPKSQGDDHLRLLKHVLRTQFSGFTQGVAITKTESQINAMLIAGDFGLGGVPVAINENAINNADLATGFYYVTPQGLGLLPGNQYCYMIYMDNPAVGFAWRFLIGANGGECYGQVKVSGNWLPLGTQWDGNNTPKQQTPLDTNANALLQPGSFGLGVTQPAGANANISNAPFMTQNLNARWYGNSWIGQPPSESTATPAIVTITSMSALYQIQEFYCLNNGARYFRHNNNGSISNWIGEGNVTSQSSAANGYQVINRIGRQWGKNNANVASGSTVVVTFPLLFTTCWGVNANISTFSGSNTYGVNITAITGANFTYGYYSNTPSGSGDVYWQAVGLV